MLRPDEREGGITPLVQEYGPFAELVDDKGLEDMRSTGRKFTWTNGSIHSKIDRVLINVQWIDIFPHIQAEFVQRVYRTIHLAVST